MRNLSKPHRRPALREMLFEQLLATDNELAEARRKYGGKSPKERRAAAEWAYDAAVAHDLFSRSVFGVGGDSDVDTGLDAGVTALAIDPLFASALLTVGSLEYQCRRRDAAMAMFLKLTTLPVGEPDLDEIIDKAGSFLLDQKDIDVRVVGRRDIMIIDQMAKRVSDCRHREADGERADLMCRG